MSDAPVAAALGGAALMDGKIYASYLGSPTMSVFDIASNLWTTMPNPVPSGTANIASDGSRYLYLAAGTSFVRFDRAAGSVTSLPPPPFAFETRGALRHLAGVLYGHQGDPHTGFAAFDIAASRWAVLPSLPSPGAMGAAIDPIARLYYVHGPYASSTLMRYSIDSGMWQTIPFLLFYAFDGGMGWLPWPDPGIYLPQGDRNTSFARLNTGTGYLQATPSSGTIAPGASLDVLLLFDSSFVPAAAYGASIEVHSNDPVRPVVAVPSSFEVVELPRMVIGGALAAAESTRDYSEAGAMTSHLLIPAGLPAGQATLRLEAEGEYWSPESTATLILAGEPLGSAGGIPLACGIASMAFAIPPESLGSLLADGVMTLQVRNSAAVGTFCPANRHTVKLSFPVASDRLDFGTAFTGQAATLTLSVVNTGAGALHLSIVSNDPSFTTTDSVMEVPPGGSWALPVAFRAAAPGAYSGVLAIGSDDPLAPLTEIPLAGTALAPPEAGVQPASFEATLSSGTVETRSLVVSNAGVTPLRFVLNASTPIRAPFLSVSPQQGVVPPGGATTVEATLDARLAPVGAHDGEIVLATNDPAHSVITIPVSLQVRGSPSIRLSEGTTTLSSTSGFDPSVGRTTHTLMLTEPPAGSGRLDLTAEGDFHFYGRTATALMEGIEVGSVGGRATPFPLCETETGSFNVPWSLMAASAEDGVIQINVMNSTQVTLACEPSRHTVRLTYHHALSLLDYGETMLGGASTRSVFVENVGGEPLIVSSFTSDSPAFMPPASPVTVPPWSAIEVSVTFSPSVEGVSTGTLGIESNDPAHPVVTLPLQGRGSPPPVLTVSPSSLDTTLRPPSMGTYTLTVGNAGVFPLAFSVVSQEPWLTITPSSGVVTSGDSMDLTVTIDSSLAVPGPHAASLTLTSNDPALPRLDLPVSLYVLGTPAMSIQGDPLTVQQSRTYTTAGALRTYRLLLAARPAGGGVVSVTAEGEFGDPDQTAAVSVEGTVRLTLGATGDACSIAAGEVSLDRDELDLMTMDGSLLVTVQNSPEVGASCPVNRHTVSLTYVPVLDQVDFGSAFTGATVRRTILVSNQGTDLLRVRSLLADPAEFTVEPGSFNLPPSGSQLVTLGFAPGSPGDYFGALVIQSNDPAQREVVLGLTGTGMPAPVMVVLPASLRSMLATGLNETQNFTISNGGESNLEFSTAVRTTGPVPFVEVAPLSGTVAPGETLSLSARFDTTGLPIGIHAGAIDVGSNDPAALLVTIPIELIVIGIPDIAIPGPPIDFGPVFPGYGAGQVLLVENRGSATLEIGSIVTDRPEFSAAPSSLSVPPGSSAAVSLTLTATSLGRVTGSVLLTSNDPDTPALAVPLTGLAVVPPVAGMDTTLLVVALPPGGATNRTVRLSNTGGSDLVWAIGTCEGAPLPKWIAVSPPAATLAAGATIDLAVNLHAGELVDGDHEATLCVNSNDPLAGRLDLSVRLHVGEIVPDRFVIEPATLDFRSNGAAVKASVQLPRGYDPHEVIVGSVLLNGVVAPIAGRTTFQDENSDGQEELILRFERSAVQALLPDGPRIAVTITGEVRDRTWFRGVTMIRVKRPQVQAVTAP